jgi:hypothetical protein
MRRIFPTLAFLAAVFCLLLCGVFVRSWFYGDRGGYDANRGTIVFVASARGIVSAEIIEGYRNADGGFWRDWEAGAAPAGYAGTYGEWFGFDRSPHVVHIWFPQLVPIVLTALPPALWWRRRRRAGTRGFEVGHFPTSDSV